MKEIILSFLELKTFTEQDALDYCQLNSINFDDITELDLSFNELTDISGVKLFKNLKYLYIAENKLKDISVLKDLNNLEFLDIENLELESDQIQYIKSLKNLKELWCKNGFKDMSIVKHKRKIFK